MISEDSHLENILNFLLGGFFNRYYFMKCLVLVGIICSSTALHSSGSTFLHLFKTESITGFILYNLSYSVEKSYGCLELSLKSKYRFIVSNLVRPPLPAISDIPTKRGAWSKKSKRNHYLV